MAQQEAKTSIKEEIDLNHALKLSRILLKCNLVPFLVSAPGIGKSSIGAQLADENNLEFVDERLSGYDQTDLNGFPMVNQETKRSFFAPQEVFPLVSGDETPEQLKAMLPKGKRGWLLFLDEFPSATPAVQNAAYKLILDKAIGQRKLHPNVRIMLAGNDITHNAFAYKSNTAIQSRVVTLNIKGNLDAAIDYAIKKKWAPEVTSFMEFEGISTVDGFDPKHKDVTFCCGRTLEFLSQQIKQLRKDGLDPTNSEFKAMYAGTIGKGMAIKFLGHMRHFGTLVSFDEILADPRNAKVPDEPSAIFGITGLIGERAMVDTIDDVMIYVKRLPVHNQVSAISKMVKNPTSDIDADTPAIDDWLEHNAAKMYSPD